VTGRVVVAGLGPGDPGLVSTAVRQAIGVIPRRFLRTARHPSAGVATPAPSFDELYESASTLEEVYAAIVERLVAEAVAGEVLYLVPGSPLVAERSVELLRRDPRVELTVIPSLSFADLAWDRLGVDPLAAGVHLVDAQAFERAAAGSAGPFLVAQCDRRLVLSEVKLAVEEGPAVTVLQRLGLPGEAVFEVAWADLDRSFEPDHLTCLYIPALPGPVAGELVALAGLVRDLRSRCDWDRAQTHASLARHLVEETYEVLDALRQVERDPVAGYPHLEEELGDLLFQVLFHATLAAEEGQFDLAGVARGIHDKLVDRHPHLFGRPGSAPPNWEERKRAEKGRDSVMDGISPDLPALLLAWKVQSKAASVGFDWPDASGVWAKVGEELAELRQAAGEGDALAVADELGDMLFSVVSLARHLGHDPELALRGAAERFTGRFRAMELLARRRGRAVGDDLWEEVKRG
jgi:tetrapyrrole methylase family protein/MazG family protein